MQHVELKLVETNNGSSGASRSKRRRPHRANTERGARRYSNASDCNLAKEWSCPRLALRLACRRPGARVRLRQRTTDRAQRVPAPPTVAQPPAQPPQGLPAGEPVASYVFSGPLDYSISGFTTGSQYLLYESGVFGLRYDAFPHV